MCYKVATPPLPELRDIATAQQLELHEYEMYYHADGFIMPYLPVTLNQEPNKIQPARWKLLPSWVKSEADGKKYANTLNATCEDIFTKASYKPYIKKYRGLLWVKGFFEPHHPEEKVTTPFFVYMKDEKPFTIGCVYAPFRLDSGAYIPTFSIITTAANSLQKRIHNKKERMPLIIQEADRAKWLSTELETEDIINLMKPLPDGLLRGHAVSNNIYSKKEYHNSPEMWVPETGEVWE